MKDNKNEKQDKNVKTDEIISLRDGDFIAETVYDYQRKISRLCVKTGNELEIKAVVILSGGVKYIPLRSHNRLLKDKVLLLPSEHTPFTNERALLKDIQNFIRKYVATSLAFETVAAHYVLLTWVYDNFNELPYLRLMGNPGSGKTRFLEVLGSLCYKGTFAGGSTTPASIMRITDKVRGTLVLDEANYQRSDMHSVIAQILNQGYSSRFPILRTEGKNGVFDPKSFCVYGPKIIATRGRFEDDALESRCLTQVMNGAVERSDIPKTLPPEFEVEALALRNQLLSYRFGYIKPESTSKSDLLNTLHPRIHQIYLPLLQVSPDQDNLNQLLATARTHHERLLEIIRDTPEYEILLGILKIAETNEKPTIQQIKQASKVEMSDRSVGEIVRKRLLLTTTRTQNGYVVPLSENQQALKEAQRRFEIAINSD